MMSTHITLIYFRGFYLLASDRVQTYGDGSYAATSEETLR